MPSPMLTHEAIVALRVAPIRNNSPRYAARAFLAAQNRDALVQVVWNAAFDVQTHPSEVFTMRQCEAVVDALLGDES